MYVLPPPQLFVAPIVCSPILTAILALFCMLRSCALIFVAFVSATRAGGPPSKQHPLGPEVHHGVHGTPQYVSADKTHAVHDFDWQDAKGRRVQLKYTATKHAPFAFVSLDTYDSLDNITVEDDLMTLSFVDLAAREQFVGRYLRERPILVGNAAWNATLAGKSTPFMVRALDLFDKDGNDVSFFFEHVSLMDAFKFLEVRYVHTLLAEDLPTHHHLHKKRRELRNVMRPLSDSTGKRRLNIFTDAIAWFGKIARGIIELAGKVVNAIITLGELLFNCGDGTCTLTEEDFSRLTGVPTSFTLLNFNWNGNTGAAAGPECVFTMGAQSQTPVQGLGNGLPHRHLQGDRHLRDAPQGHRYGRVRVQDALWRWYL